jgi:hypothetical protein
MAKSDLPFGSEFSPSQIELPWLLETANESKGDWQLFENAVYEKYFKNETTEESNSRKLANNTKLGMAAYGIIKNTKDTRFTDFGNELYALKDDDEKLYKHLAKHILLNLHGLTMIETIKDMQASGATVSLVTLREWLEERGINFPRGGKHPSMMRLWLEKAKVFDSGWRANQAKIDEILGVAEEDIEALANLNAEQRAYLRTLANIGDTKPRQSNEIEKLATATYGTRFDEKNLPKKVLYPLQEAGFIQLQRETSGRGAKPFLVTPTEKLVREVFEPILEQAEQWADKDLRQLLRKPLDEILGELGSKNTYEKGLALEALAFKLMRLLDMSYVRTRLRGAATGGAEVDLIFESSRLVFSRWQVQCKNVSGGVSLEDVAKEVGLTHMLKSNVIVIVSTGQIGGEARKYANLIMKESNLCIVMVDRDDIEQIKANAPAIIDVFNREARRTMELKALPEDV